MSCPYESVQKRSILTVLKDSLKDSPSQDGQDMSENEVRYKLIIDPSEDDSLIRLLFSLGVLDRQNTRMYVCSDFPGDSQIQKVCVDCIYCAHNTMYCVCKIPCYVHVYKYIHVHCIYIHTHTLYIFQYSQFSLLHLHLYIHV